MCRAVRSLGLGCRTKMYLQAEMTTCKPWTAIEDGLDPERYSLCRHSFFYLSFTQPSFAHRSQD